MPYAIDEKTLVTYILPTSENIFWMDIMDNLIEVLQERGLVEGITSDALKDAVKEPVRVYCGFDPTADSLHLGHMVALMGLAWFQRYGHTPVALVGGATAMIGDPSGKSRERQLLDQATIDNNLFGVKKNLEAFLDFKHPTAKPIVVNNYDWLSKFTLLDFLRDVGRYFRMGPMLAKDSVRQRLQSEEGMSFTEFSYQLLQGYDFLHLYRDLSVTVQLGGADQWGNIVGGVDLIRKVEGAAVYGITWPLLTNSEGKKMGKTEGGAVWLSPEKLSHYEFFQCVFATPDADVIKLLRLLTFLPMPDISRLEALMKTPDYVPNTVQRILAEEVTRIVRGEEGLQAALRATEAARPGSDTLLDAPTLEMAAKDIPSHSMPYGEVVGAKLIDLLVTTGLQGTKSDARRLVRNAGAYINNEPIEDENYVVTAQNLIENKLLLLAVGKKKKLLVRVV